MGLPIHGITVLGTWAASGPARRLHCEHKAHTPRLTVVDHAVGLQCQCITPWAPTEKNQPTAYRWQDTGVQLIFQDQSKLLSTAVNRNKRSTKFNQPLAKPTQPQSGIPTQMRNPPRHVQGLRANPVSLSRKVLRLSAEVCWHVTLNQGEDIETWGPVF